MRTFALLALLAVVIVAGCTTTGNTPTAATGAVAADTAVTDRPVKEFSMTSFYEIVNGQPKPQFSVKELTVNEGDLVRITVTNTKGIHDFNLDEFSVHSPTPPNEPVTVEFVADKAGDFVYYCNSPGHRANGHWGTLHIVAA